MYVCSYVASMPIYVYRLEPQLGKFEPHSADSCKQIKSYKPKNKCTNDSIQSGVYWIKHMQVIIIAMCKIYHYQES